MLIESNSNVIDSIEILTYISLSINTRAFMNNASSLDDFDERTGLDGRANQIFKHHGDKNINEKRNKNTQQKVGHSKNPLVYSSNCNKKSKINVILLLTLSMKPQDFGCSYYLLFKY